MYLKLVSVTGRFAFSEVPTSSARAKGQGEGEFCECSIVREAPEVSPATTSSTDVGIKGPASRGFHMSAANPQHRRWCDLNLGGSDAMSDGYVTDVLSTADASTSPSIL